MISPSVFSGKSVCTRYLSANYRSFNYQSLVSYDACELSNSITGIGTRESRKASKYIKRSG